MIIDIYEYEFLIDRGFDLKRQSEDLRTNNYDNKVELIDMCKSLGILIANGRLLGPNPKVGGL